MTDGWADLPADDGPVCVGVDGCRGGWVAAIEHRPGAIDIAVHPTFAGLLASLPDDAIVAVDMPIGLPDLCARGGRGPESHVRPLLGARQSSVFSVPSRAAVHAASDDEMALDWYGAHRKASAVARETSMPPRGVSIQCFGLFRKIREIDALLISRPELRDRIFEAHPELAFWRMNGRVSLGSPKKVRNAVHGLGMDERTALLVANGIPAGVLSMPVPRGADRDDRLDALAMLTVARRAVRGDIERLPPEPVRDSQGIAMAIHF